MLQSANWYSSNLLTAIVLILSALDLKPLNAGEKWQTCSFNSRVEECQLAGSLSSFSITYRTDNKKIEVEKVGSAHECGDGSTDQCGKMIIKEPVARRATWASYRQTSSTIIMRSSRGNIYKIPRSEGTAQP